MISEIAIYASSKLVSSVEAKTAKDFNSFNCFLTFLVRKNLLIMFYLLLILLKSGQIFVLLVGLCSPYF